MKAKTILIAVFCILSLAGCRNGTNDIPASDVTESVQSAESAETTSDEAVAKTEAIRNDTEQSAAAESTGGQRLTLEEAKAAALEHAGVNEPEAVNIKTEFDHDDGVNVIEVKFDTVSYEYEYEINADNGNIIKSSKEALTEQTPRNAITAEEAENIALKHAGIKRSDAVFEKTERDFDDGVEKFEVKFICGGVEYEYDIGAADGSVIKYSTEKAAVQTIQNSAKNITAEDAENIALKHAGLKRSGVTFEKTERDFDDGVEKFEVKFICGGVEYEYDIGAADGSVIKYSTEKAAVQTIQNSAKNITAEDAENIALKHAGLKRSGVTFEKTERDFDDGVEKFEVKFICGGQEYEYEINAAGGDIIKFEIDEIDD